MAEEAVNTAAAPEEAAPPPKKKHHFFRKFMWFMLVVMIIWWFNNFTLKTTREEITSDKINGTLKIAVLSDFHAQKLVVSPDTVVTRLEKEEPDLICILGDMYTRKSSEKKIQIAIDLISDITDLGKPVFFVPGEHDKDDFYFEELSALGVHILRGESEQIIINENDAKNATKLNIMGLSNVYYAPNFDVNSYFSLDESCFNLLLAHIPNFEKFADFGADLTLCGDTHGGMIQLPLDKGPAYYQGEWFPQFKSGDDNIYDKGMFSYRGGKMFITSGLGNYPYPARLNNRPEIAVIEINS